MFIIGIDIGTTNIKFVLLKNQQIIKKKKILTPKNKKEIIKVLKENIKELTKEKRKSEISGIGIGVPGPLNEKRDLILNPPNLRALKNFPLAKIIEKELKIKTKMENDANCFTLAEALLGAGKEAKIVLGITLGSGLGGGIVFKMSNVKCQMSNAKCQMSNKIYKGSFGSAGEFGHMTIKFDGKKCSCGSIGCFEEYACERFFKREAKICSIEVFEKAKRGEKFALKIFQEFGKNLGRGLANLINILDPEIIVLGGGISKAHKFFLKECQKEIKKRVLSPISKKFVKIKIAKFGDFSGAIGAALLNLI